MNINYPVFFETETGLIYDAQHNRIAEVFVKDMGYTIAAAINEKEEGRQKQEEYQLKYFTGELKMCTRNPDFECTENCTHWCKLK